MNSTARSRKELRKQAVALNLRPVSFVILGMIGLGTKAGLPTSGYAIKTAAARWTNSIWSISLALVYPELARLEDLGYVTGRPDPRGALMRSTYKLTDRGHERLLRWLRAYRPDCDGPMVVRDEGLLRLFFADLLDADEQRELIGAMRQRLTVIATRMHAELADDIARETLAGAWRHSARLKFVRADVHDFIERWLAYVDQSIASVGHAVAPSSADLPSRPDFATAARSYPVYATRR